MTQNVTNSMFHDAFIDMNRADNFSYEALNALFDYLNEIGEGPETEYDLDVIAICCEYTEYDNIKEFQSNYGLEYKSIEDIEQTTTVLRIENSDSFVIHQF